MESVYYHTGNVKLESDKGGSGGYDYYMDDSDDDEEEEDERPDRTRAFSIHLYCDICDVHCSGPQLLQEHFGGSKHRRNLERAGLNVALKDYVERPKDVEIWNKVVRCLLCKILFLGCDSMIHKGCPSHQKKLAVMSQRNHEFYDDSNNCFKEVVMGGSMADDDEDDGNIESRSRYHCDLCLLEFSGQDHLQIHVRGKKHQKKLRLMFIQEVSGSGNVDKGVPCSLCGIYVDRIEDLDRHFHGRGHKQRALEHTTSKSRHYSIEHTSQSSHHDYITTLDHTSRSRHDSLDHTSRSRHDSLDHTSRSRHDSLDHTSHDSLDHTSRSRHDSLDHTSRSGYDSLDHTSRSRYDSLDHTSKSRRYSLDHTSRSRQDSLDHTSRSRQDSLDHTSTTRHHSSSGHTRSRHGSSDHTPTTRHHSDHTSASRRDSSDHTPRSRYHSLDHTSDDRHPSGHTSSSNHYTTEPASPTGSEEVFQELPFSEWSSVFRDLPEYNPRLPRILRHSRPRPICKVLYSYPLLAVGEFVKKLGEYDHVLAEMEEKTKEEMRTRAIEKEKEKKLLEENKRGSYNRSFRGGRPRPYRSRDEPYQGQGREFRSSGRDLREKLIRREGKR